MESNTNNQAPNADTTEAETAVDLPAGKAGVPQREEVPTTSEPNTSIKKAPIVLGILLIILGAVAVAAYFYPAIFTKNSPTITIENAHSAIAKKYELSINLPDSWIARDCTPENKTYLNGTTKYVCRWSSPPHPESGLSTHLFLFALNDDREPSNEKLTQFVRERQEYAWQGEMSRNPALSVTLDNEFDTVSYDNLSGLIAEDIVINTELGGWDTWTSTTIRIVTNATTMLLEVNHPNNTHSGRVVYTVEDVLEHVSLIEK